MGRGSDDPGSQATLRLPVRPESAAVGRRFIATTLADWDLAPLRDTAVLLGNELVTNALLHAGSAVEVELTRNRVTVRIAVHDGAMRAPARRFYGVEAASGRGLAMVEAMADGWGIILRPPAGKTVWFELLMNDGRGVVRRRPGPARPAGAGAGASY